MMWKKVNKRNVQYDKV